MLKEIYMFENIVNYVHCVGGWRVEDWFMKLKKEEILGVLQVGWWIGFVLQIIETLYIFFSNQKIYIFFLFLITVLYYALFIYLFIMFFLLDFLLIQEERFSTLLFFTHFMFYLLVKAWKSIVQTKSKT